MPRRSILTERQRSALFDLPTDQATILRHYSQNTELQPVGFLRRGSKWHRHLNACDEDKHRLWEVAVLFHLRDAFRSGDIWLAHSRRYADVKQALPQALRIFPFVRCVWRSFQNPLSAGTALAVITASYLDAKGRCPSRSQWVKAQAPVSQIIFPCPASIPREAK